MGTFIFFSNLDEFQQLLLKLLLFVAFIISNNINTQNCLHCITLSIPSDHVVYKITY